MNSNTFDTITQIENSLKTLTDQNIVIYKNEPNIVCDKVKKTEQITWYNQKYCINTGNKYFNSVNQYLNILKANAYHALLFDYSIIRFSFKFKKGKLLSQNLLWWPCPIKMDKEMEEEFGIVEALNLLLTEQNVFESFDMRTPIRIDFDVTNNTPTHPGSHVHMQHYKSRINTNEPICFNTFIKYIFESCYPNYKINFRRWGTLYYNYDNKNEEILYNSNINIKIKTSNN